MVLTDFSLRSGTRDLSEWQRWVLSGLVVGAHVIVGLAIWHTASEAVAPAERPPLMVSLISEDVVVPTTPPTVQPPKPEPRPVVQPTPRRETPPVMASTRVAQAQDLVVPAVVPEPQPAQPVVAPAPVQAAASAVPAEPPPPQQPKTLPSSAVRFLVKPDPAYPQASQELGESGVVSMRLLVDEQGRVKDVQIIKSSGYARLDRAAVAAERAARLQPYVDNGVPRSVWAPHSINFNLDER